VAAFVLDLEGDLDVEPPRCCLPLTALSSPALPLPGAAPASQRCFLSSNLATSAEHSSLMASSSFRNRFRFFFIVFFISSSSSED
jgi:hypothetical protein